MNSLSMPLTLPPLSVFHMVLMCVAAFAAIITYMTIPRLPVVAIVSASAIALAAATWWHWVQFSSEYRLSTWQDQLRNYSSYVIVLTVILCSYGFYVFGWSGSTLQDIATSSSRTLSTLSNTLMSDASSGSDDDEENEDEDDGEGEGGEADSGNGLLGDLLGQNGNSNRNGNRNRNRVLPKAGNGNTNANANRNKNTTANANRNKNTAANANRNRNGNGNANRKLNY